MGYDNCINMHLTNDLEGPLATQNSQLRLYAIKCPTNHIAPRIVSEKISRPRWFDALFASPSALAQWENSIYANDDKDDQISTNQVDEIVVPESGLGDVYSCGRARSTGSIKTPSRKSASSAVQARIPGVVI
ncbi:hypothetical protein I7I51_00720 [Histoplasma capsulatum]|uniref:Uncharacterized protein n=1 Tax=Ajellomyces capsulatus TaxID=5037 RepID=A0A8A1MCK7_AJECA|nr:hypothetical protein I7I51_00720 [Histoplasma capsulatum]